MGSITPEESKRTGSWIAWLEKQGEHAKFRDSIQIGDKVTRNQDGVLVNLSQLKRVAKKDEKQGEQKPADKVEPKFHEGEWVVYECGEETATLQITRIVGETYVFSDDSTLSVVDEDALRLWDITKDAKDGDLLADNYGIYIFDRFDEYDKRCYFCRGAYQYSQKVYENEHLLCSVEVHPATKEQCDLLFAKMKEAGYEWDAEKKELKKIVNEEQIKKNLQDNSFRRMFEQKPADESSAFKNKLLELFQKFRYIKKGVPTNGDIIDYVDAHIQELIDTVQNNPWSEEDKKMSRFIGNAITATDASMYLESKGIQIIDAHVWLDELKDRVQSQSKQEWNKEDEYNHNME